MKENFKLVGRFQYTYEAMIHKGKLESEGIKVYIWDNNTIDLNPQYSNAIGGVKLFVKNEDCQKAEKLLAEISQFSIDDNNQLIKCKKCNEKQIEMYASIKDVKSFFSFVISIFLFLIPFHAKYKYRCNNCKLEFN